MNLNFKLFILSVFLIFSNASFSAGVVTIKGSVYSSADNSPIANLPVRIYPNRNDSLYYYTVYTNAAGFFVLSLQSDEIQGNAVVVSMDNYIGNRLVPLMDTVNLSDLNNNIRFYVRLAHYKSYVIYGYVKDKTTHQPIENKEIYIQQKNIKIFPDVVKTDCEGFYSDTIYASDTMMFKYDVYVFSSDNKQITKNVVLGKNIAKKEVDFRIKAQDASDDWRTSVYYVIDNENQMAYLKLLSNLPVDSVIWKVSGNLLSKSGSFIKHFQPGTYLIIANIYRNGKNKLIKQRIVIGGIDSISGKVFAGNSYLSKGYVLAFKDDGEDMKFINYTKVENGNFVFESLLKGNYLFYALPDFGIDTPYYPIYLPTYFGGDKSWQTAQAISLNQKNNGLDIYLDKYDGFMYGKKIVDVTVDTSLFDYSDILTVLLFDNDKALIDSKVLKDKSICRFKNLSAGKYFMRVELPGMQCDDAPLDMKKNTVAQIDFSSDFQGHIGYVLTDIDLNDKPQISVFPNPCSKYLHIETDENMIFEMYTMSGNKIMRKDLSKIENIDVSMLNRGIYQGVFKKNNKIIETKVIIIQ